MFKILTDSDNNELDLLENWGKATKKQVKEWVQHLQGNFGDKFDKDNLKLSAHALRNSIGPNLLAHVISLTGAAATGPELFLVAVQPSELHDCSIGQDCVHQDCWFEAEVVSRRECGQVG